MIDMTKYEEMKKDMQEYGDIIKTMLPEDIYDIDEDTFKMIRIGFRMLRHCQALMDDQVNTLNSIEEKLDRILANQAKA